MSDFFDVLSFYHLGIINSYLTPDFFGQWVCLVQEYLTRIFLVFLYLLHLFSLKQRLFPDILSYDFLAYDGYYYLTDILLLFFGPIPFLGTMSTVFLLKLFTLLWQWFLHWSQLMYHRFFCFSNFFLLTNCNNDWLCNTGYLFRGITRFLSLRYLFSTDSRWYCTLKSQLLLVNFYFVLPQLQINRALFSLVFTTYVQFCTHIVVIFSSFWQPTFLADLKKLAHVLISIMSTVLQVTINIVTLTINKRFNLWQPNYRF